MKRTLRPLLLAVSLYGWAAAAGGVFLLAGCGGGGATPAGAPTVAAPSAPAAPAGRGGLEVLIKWPPVPAESSRLIPAAARSILVVVTTTDGRRLGEQFSTRPFTGEKQTPPTDTAFFPDLPAGPVLVLASAFPSDDGTGVPQATGSLTTTVVANQKTRTPPAIWS